MQSLHPEDKYKYLGIAQHSSIDHTALKKEFKDKYKTRLTKLLNTNLYSKNLITAINTWAVPVLTYSFGILKYSNSDLQELDRLTRRLMKKFRIHHPKTAIERVYLPRKEGGRGLVNIYQLCKKQENDIREYFLKMENRIAQNVVAADQGYTPLNLARGRHNVELVQETDMQRSWREKVLHGKYPTSLAKENIDKEGSLIWLRKGYLYPETEGFIMAIQDEVVRTRNYEKHILKRDIEDRCRKCRAPRETIDHIIAGCPTLANNAYLGRHNQIAKVIHRLLAQKYGLLKNPAPYYKYNPEQVLESREYVLYWDTPMITDRTVDFNRPDIVFIGKTSKTATIIDIGCPLTHNIGKTEIDKRTKYENLAIEIKHIWGTETIKIVPIVVSATGVVSTDLKKYLEHLEISSTIIETIQKVAILQTCHIVRKFLDSLG